MSGAVLGHDLDHDVREFEVMPTDCRPNRALNMFEVGRLDKYQLGYYNPTEILVADYSDKDRKEG